MNLALIILRSAAINLAAAKKWNRRFRSETDKAFNDGVIWASAIVLRVNLSHLPKSEQREIGAFIRKQLALEGGEK